MDSKPKKLQREARFSTKSGGFGRGRFKRIKLKKPERWRSPSRRTALALLIIFCFLVGIVGGVAGSALYYHNHSLSSASVSQKQQYVSNEGQLISQIAKNVGQSVVSVDVTSQATSQDLFGFTQSQSQQSAGTGFSTTTARTGDRRATCSARSSSRPACEPRT